MSDGIPGCLTGEQLLLVRSLLAGSSFKPNPINEEIRELERLGFVRVVKSFSLDPFDGERVEVTEAARAVVRLRDQILTLRRVIGTV